MESKLACIYFVVAVLWSGYQGFRGAVEQSWQNGAKITDTWKRWVILYVHDFAFRFVCTMAGFAAFYALSLIVGKVTDWTRVEPGLATLMVACFLIGVIGVGGQLHYVILLGKVIPISEFKEPPKEQR